jgi:hypothetical protein
MLTSRWTGLAKETWHLSRRWCAFILAPYEKLAIYVPGFKTQVHASHLDIVHHLLTKAHCAIALVVAGMVASTGQR